MPKVSIIIPVYNVENYLSRCLDSVINQTLKDIEIIVINDCSTDDSLKILKEYAKQDERIKLIDLPKNQGAAVARNKGLEIAKGEYLGFVDPDDEIDLNFYEVLYDKTSRKKLDIVKCQRIKIAEDGTRKPGHLNNDIRKTKSIYSFTYEWQTAIYRSSMIFDNHINFPPDVRKAQDVVFLSKVVMKTEKYALIDSVNYYQYAREDSLDAKKIPIENVKSALLAVQYISQEYDNAFMDAKLSKEDYLNLYHNNIQVILTHTMFQNDSEEAKRLCLEKYIELNNKCKMTPEKLSSPIYRNIIEIIKNNDVETLIEAFRECNNFNQIILYFLRRKVEKDVQNV